MRLVADLPRTVVNLPITIYRLPLRRQAGVFALGAAALGAYYYVRAGGPLAEAADAADAPDAQAEDGSPKLASGFASWLPSLLGGTAEERAAARALEDDSWD